MEKEIEELTTIHNMFKYFLDRKNYTFVVQLLKQFDENSDINELKTIMVITKAFKSHELLSEERSRIVQIFSDKLGYVI